MTGADLKQRLATLGISPEVLAVMVRRPLSDVETWMKSTGPIGGEAAILLRCLADDHRATIAAEKVRNTYVRDLRGEAPERHGLPVPATGGGTATGGPPK
jgi:hypothetical protein